MKWLATYHLLLTILFYGSFAREYIELSESEIDTLLQNYDKSKSPTQDGPTEVLIGMYAISADLDVDTSTLVIEVYLRQQWTDPNLADAVPANTTGRTPEGTWDRVWTPDTFFTNALEVQVFPEPHSHRLLNLKEDGQVWYVLRLKMSIYCPEMSTGDSGPGSTFTCPVRFESFGYTMQHLDYGWLERPFQVDKNINFQQFILEDVEYLDCSQNYTAGEFPCLEIQTVFSHTLTPRHLFGSGIYVSSFFLVLLSWVPLWFDSSKLFYRYGLGLFFTLILVLEMIGVGLYERGYGRSKLLVWLVVDIVLSVIVLLETTLAHVLLVIVPDTIKKLRSGNKQEQAENPKMNRIGRIIDVAFAVIILPVIFILFVIAFFATY